MKNYEICTYQLMVRRHYKMLSMYIAGLYRNWVRVKMGKSKEIGNILKHTNIIIIRRNKHYKYIYIIANNSILTKSHLLLIQMSDHSL